MNNLKEQETGIKYMSDMFNSNEESYGISNNENFFNNPDKKTSKHATYFESEIQPYNTTKEAPLLPVLESTKTQLEKIGIPNIRFTLGKNSEYSITSEDLSKDNNNNGIPDFIDTIIQGFMPNANVSEMTEKALKIYNVVRLFIILAFLSMFMPFFFGLLAVVFSGF